MRAIRGASLLFCASSDRALGKDALNTATHAGGGLGYFMPYRLQAAEHLAGIDRGQAKVADFWKDIGPRVIKN